MKCYIRKISVVSGIAALCLGTMLWSVSAVTGTTRHYYVAAEEATWDYAPSGEDRVHGGPIPKPWAGHTLWPKVRYLEYTDASFATPKPRPKWLGVLGPILRAWLVDSFLKKGRIESKS